MEPGGETDALRAALDMLRVVELDAPPLWPRLVEALRGLLDAEQAAIYRPVPALEPGWTLELAHWSGFAIEPTPLFERYLARLGDGWQPGYDPAHPEPWQRNRALRPLAHLTRAALAAHPIRRLQDEVGLDPRHDQLRALICDGETLIAWVGGFRLGDFGEREASLLDALVPALLRRFRLERMLSEHELFQRGLTVALDAVTAPALISTQRGRVLYANASGRRQLDKDPDARAELAALLARFGKEQSAETSWSVTPLAEVGSSDAFLLVQRTDARLLQQRVALGASVWKLTRRQAEVLALLARGLGNKEIALELSCSVRTIELHVSALLRKSDADSRSEVLAQLAALE